MKFLMAVAAFAALTCGALSVGSGAAFAQTSDDDDRFDLVKSLLTETADDGDKLVGRLRSGALEEGDSDEFTIRINPRKSYSVRGACDFDCDDLDITILDADGDEVDSDSMDDDAPIVIFGPGDAGREITVQVDMATCSEDDCVWAVGVYEVED